MATTSSRLHGRPARLHTFVRACAAVLCAAALLLCALASPAQALVTEKTTAKGTNSSGDIVLGGVPTRITWEGTVGEDETLGGLTFTFPEGTSASDESQIRVTVLEGLTRIAVEFESTITSDDARIVFPEPVAAGSLVRVELYKVAPPAETHTFQMDLAYTNGKGEAVVMDKTPGVEVMEQGVVENIVDWLDQQAWVAAWNSNTFLRLFFNPQLAVQAVPDLFVGWLRALSLVCIGFPLAIPIGFGLAFMRMSGLAILRGIASAYVNVVRGTPLFLQIYIYFFGLPLLGINIDSFVLGIFALALNSSAYLCEIFRAGIQSIPKGQFEAARSLGMTGAQTMFSVIIPQSVRRVIPTATSEFILLYKDTSLLASVGVMELMMFSKSLTASTGNITPYIVAAGYYLIVTLPLTKLIGTLEKKLAAADGVRPDADDKEREEGEKLAAAKASALVAAASAGDVTPIVIQNEIEIEAAQKAAREGRDL